MPLSPFSILNAEPRDKPYKLADAEGLYLLVAPSGGRLWRMDYRYLGRRRTLALGAFPSVGRAEARREREAAKVMLSKGLDPSQERARARAAARIAAGNTFRVVGEDWRAKRLQERLSDATIEKDRYILEDYAYPAFGDVAINTLGPRDVLEVIRKMERRGNNELAHRFKSVVARVFRYAVVTERADRDPTADLSGALVSRSVNHHAGLTDPLAVGKLMLAVEGYQGFPATRLALKFLAHTFVRTKEMRFARKDQFDLDARLWRIPMGTMKKRREHLVPLSGQVVAIIEEMLTFDYPGPWLFPGAWGDDRTLSDNTVNGALRRLGYSTDQHVGHGFRTTASTTLNESGRFEPDWIERQLSHVDRNTTRSAYNAALYLPQRAAMMQWYSDWLDAQRDIARLLG